MDTTPHTLQTLFAQLGLPGANEADIERFVAGHRPLAPDVTLADAPFWTPGQAQFLREEINEDAEWAEVVDQLNAMLRA
ncbi:DUF2789 domain-containing protein [Variovorax rhizosphaerae]|uniref:DUF2789 domain-containing protein n=1 Tax=Variovorax rhizosphaerae TaxID=1836200 RepID=A0ABU8WWB1_9BURK